MSQAERTTEEIPEWKREEVAELEELLEDFDSVGVVDITGIPSKQLQTMRRDLHGTAELRVSRNTLLELALESVDEGLEDLVEYVSGQVGLIGTDENPFSLYQELEASKTPAPIGAGEVAPNDLVIPEGDTGIDPGPFVGELQNVGAEARIDEGSITVTADSTVLEAGEVVSQDLANVLTELGIEPKEVGLDLRGAVSEGVLFTDEDLDIDVEAYREDVATAATHARNLAVNAAVPADGVVSSLITRATAEAKGLALAAAIEDEAVLPDLVAQADAQVRALVAQIDDEEALPEDLQDLEAPAGATDEAEADEADDAQDDEPQEAEPEADDEDDDDADDEADAGGLGDMFG